MGEAWWLNAGGVVAQCWEAWWLNAGGVVAQWLGGVVAQWGRRGGSMVGGMVA
jgi:hypothetical protein